MHPPPPRVRPPQPPPPTQTSFLSLPYELRHQIYHLALRSLPRVKPMRSPGPGHTPIYCLQHLDPRPLLSVHPQIRHEVQALLASRGTRIQIPAVLGHGGKSTLSAPTQRWLRESGGIEFRRVRVWSDLPVPIILDVDVDVEDGADVDADDQVAVRYRWRWRPCRFRLYSWGLAIVALALPVMVEYLVEGLRRRVGARGGAGVGAGEIDFLMEGMDRFRNWVAVHRRLRSWDSRLCAESYEEKINGMRFVEDEDKEDFRRRLRWWDGVEAEVRELKMAR